MVLGGNRSHQSLIFPHKIGMNQQAHKFRWLLYLLTIFGLAILGLLMSSALPGKQIGFAAAFLPSPSSTIALYNPSNQVKSTLTPFQPLPTDTPTPTATNTPVPTATATNTATPPPPPTSTPRPTSASVDGIPLEASISGVTGYAQNHNLSCESRSAVDWARYYGVSITEAEFQSRLPLSDNPDVGFVGYVDDPMGQIPPRSYGVHAGPVAQVLKDFGLSATAGKGYSFDNLRRQVANGDPVIVWIIGNTWSGYPLSYTADDGETVTVAHFEHTAIVVGYDEYGVTLVDNNLVYWRATSEFLGSWSVLGNMAITSD